MLGKGGRGLPCGLSWGRGGEWEEDTLHWEAGRTLGLRGVLAPVTGRGSRRRGRVGAGPGAEPGERAAGRRLGGTLGAYWATQNAQNSDAWSVRGGFPSARIFPTLSN